MYSLWNAGIGINKQGGSGITLFSVKNGVLFLHHEFLFRLQTDISSFSFWCLRKGRCSVLRKRLNMEDFGTFSCLHILMTISGANLVLFHFHRYYRLLMAVHEQSTTDTQVNCVQGEKRICFSLQQYGTLDYDGSTIYCIEPRNKNEARGTPELIASIGNEPMAHAFTVTIILHGRA